MHPKSLSFLIALIVGLSLYVHAGDKRHFFGTWEPPEVLQQFWAPIDEAWWNKGTTPRLDRYCRKFAQRSNPQIIIPAMVADLKAYPSEIRPFVYIDVMKNWPSSTITRILKPFHKSRDPEIRKIADDLGADFEPES